MDMDPQSGFSLLPRAGLVFRRYQGEPDLPAMLAVFRSTRVAGQDLDHEDTVIESMADLANKYRPRPHFDPGQDVLIAEVDGQMVAYSRVTWRELEASGERIYFMDWSIRPEWHGQGLEKTFLHADQERLRQIIRQQDREAAFSGARLFEAQAIDSQPEVARVLEEDGFQVVRWSALMTCADLQNVPDVPMPAGLEVRPVTAQHARPIWDALLDAFHDHPGYSEPSEDDYATWRQNSQFQPELWQVAWEGDQIAGMVLNYVTRNSAGDEPGTAWTEDVCVRRPWRQRGLARALLARSMSMFRELGFIRTSLGVDLNNLQGANRLYESMGYRRVRLFTAYRKPVDL
jgi:ribosomal protein S18 acetylase RimI-like enzyme